MPHMPMSEDTTTRQTPALSLWPTELVEAILSNLSSTADLKQVRLVNKRFAEIAARRIFDEVHIALFLDCLEKLENISQSLSLAPLVKRLVYHGELLPPYSTQESWETRIDARPSMAARYREIRQDDSLSREDKKEMKLELDLAHAKTPRHFFQPRELKEHYARYYHLQQHQERWGERSRKRLAAAVCRLNNLEEAKVERDQFSTCSARTRPVWNRMWDVLKQSPDNWRIMGRAQVRHYEPQWAEDPSPDFTSHTDWEGVVQISDLLWSLSKRSEISENKPLTSLDFFTYSNAFWRAIHINALGWDDKRFDLYKPAFTHLKKLRMDIEFVISEDGSREIPGLLHSLLKEAKDLERLDLSFQEGHNDSPHANQAWADGLIPFHEQQTRWPRLHTLNLGICTTERHLVFLLEQHAPTLRSLSLADCAFRKGTGTWVSLITQIPKILKLDKIYLEGLYDDSFDAREYCLFESLEGNDYEKAIFDYCLHGGPVVPHIDPEAWNEANPNNMVGGAVLGEDEDGEGGWETEGDDGFDDFGPDEEIMMRDPMDGDWIDEDSDDEFEFEFDTMQHTHHGMPGMDAMGMMALMNRDSSSADFWWSMANA